MIILTQTFATAQDSLQHNPFWLNVSVGGSPKYFNFSSSYNKVLEKLSYQISINASTESFLSNYEMTTGNIGIGFAHYKEWLISSIYLGPSLSYGEALTNSDQAVYFWGAGLALNAQAYFMPLHKLIPGVGLGIELFYNLNAIQTKEVNYRNVYSVRIGFCLTNIHMH